MLIPNFVDNLGAIPAYIAQRALEIYTDNAVKATRLKDRSLVSSDEEVLPLRFITGSSFLEAGKMFSDLGTVLTSRSRRLLDCVVCERYIVKAQPSEAKFYGRRYIDKNGVKIVVPLSRECILDFHDAPGKTVRKTMEVSEAYVVSDRVLANCQTEGSGIFLVMLFLDVDLDHFLTDIDKSAEFPLA